MNLSAPHVLENSKFCDLNVKYINIYEYMYISGLPIIMLVSLFFLNSQIFFNALQKTKSVMTRLESVLDGLNLFFFF